MPKSPSWFLASLHSGPFLHSHTWFPGWQHHGKNSFLVRSRTAMGTAKLPNMGLPARAPLHYKDLRLTIPSLVHSFIHVVVMSEALYRQIQKSKTHHLFFYNLWKRNNKVYEDKIIQQYLHSYEGKSVIQVKHLLILVLKPCERVYERLVNVSKALFCLNSLRPIKAKDQWSSPEVQRSKK